MKIQEQDRYHGVALMQIVEHASFKALNRASKGYGHYLVNTKVHVFVRYRKTAKPWVFPFQHYDVSAIQAQIKAGNSVFVALVCGSETICALNAVELAQVISLTQTASQSIRVEVPSGGSCHVSGSKGKLLRTIPHKSFPDKLF